MTYLPTSDLLMIKDKRGSVTCNSKHHASPVLDAYILLVPPASSTEPQVRVSEDVENIRRISNLTK